MRTLIDLLTHVVTRAGTGRTRQLTVVFNVRHVRGIGVTADTGHAVIFRVRPVGKMRGVDRSGRTDQIRVGVAIEAGRVRMVLDLAELPVVLDGTPPRTVASASADGVPLLPYLHRRLADLAGSQEHR